MIVLGADTHKRSHTLAAVDGGDRRAGRRADGRRSAPRASPRCVRLGARARRRAGVGARGLPACLGRLGAVSDRARRARRARGAEADGRTRVAARASAASPTASTRSRSRGRRCAKASRRCRPRSWTGPSSRSGCSSIIASAWSPAHRAQQHAALASARPLARAQAARRRAVLRQLVDHASPAGWRAPSRRCASGSPATSCGRIRELTAADQARSRPSSPACVAAVAPQLLAEPGCGPLTAAKLIGEIAGAERFASDAKLARAAGVGPIPAQLRQHQPPPPRPRRQPPAQLRAATASPSPAPRCDPETRDYIARKTRRRQDPPAKPSAASSATSPAASGTSCARAHHAATSDPPHIPRINLLDIDGMCRGVCPGGRVGTSSAQARSWSAQALLTVEREEAPGDDRNGTRPAPSADHRRVAGHRRRGEVSRARIAPADRAGVRRFAERFRGQELEVALEATTGWRFVVEELQAVGAQVHLAEPAETAARRGTKKRAKSDRADARHLRELLMVGRLPESWIPPEHLLDLRARVRLRHTLVDAAPRVAAAHAGGALSPRRPAAQLADDRRVARLAGAAWSCRRRRASRSRSRWR